MKKIAEFKTGETAPQWLVEMRNCELTFLVDVDVYKSESGAIRAYPKQEPADGHVVLSKTIVESWPSTLNFSTAIIYKYPYGDERNKFKGISNWESEGK